MSGRGRGRGISNAPAWMTRQNKLGNGGGGDGPTCLPAQPSANQDRDAFGRSPRGGGPPGGPPSSSGQSRYPPHHDRRGGGGGGGGPYDDRRRGPYDDRRRGSFDDRRRGGPDNWNGSPPGRRGGGDRRDGHRDGGPGRENLGNRRNNYNDNINTSSSREQLGIINFRSYEEEQDWAEERRRKRKDRASKFDVVPTPQQLAAEAAGDVASNPAATDFAGIPAGRDFSVVPQQTRHARRLYIGHLPPNVNEQELHVFFRNAIERALSKADGEEENNREDATDPILSVYINHERRFCFLEFRDVAMTTACMALDGININGKGKVKVKRPNDYNPTMAPKVHPSSIPVLDVSKLGIISSNVQDGPNKVFIGGLHYHLTEARVLELLLAFGKIKAFHLVKNEPDSATSKGYCFVEFADPNSTPVAVMGLNGMDMGGGKVLTARVAGQRGSTATVQQIQPQSFGAGAGADSIGPDALIVNGYEIEALVDAAMGLKPMPTAPTHVDQFGIPITKISSGNLPPPVSVPPVPRMPAVPGLSIANVAGAPPPPPPQIAATAALPPGSSALDIANAALDAAFGPGAIAAPPPARTPTRILVLLNMVANEDLESDMEYSGLMEEVEEEVRKFGKLLSIQIPRKASASIEPSAVGKIFLEYATTQDSANAEQELSGRQFGPNVVQANYHDEQEYAALKLR